MLAMTLVSNLKRWVGVGLIVIGATACSRPLEDVQARQFEIQQQWQLQPGSLVSGRRISGGLGDISVDLGGSAIHAPFNGEIQPYEQRCLIYSTPEVPAYLFRLCGLDNVNFGDIKRGEVIGRGAVLQFAALRKQPSGQWAMVEPSVAMLESVLAKP